MKIISNDIKNVSRARYKEAGKPSRLAMATTKTTMFRGSLRSVVDVRALVPSQMLHTGDVDVNNLVLFNTYP